MNEFKEIEYSEAIEFLLPRHYLGRKPSVSHSYGYYEDNILKIVMTIGKPASYTLCTGVCGKEYSSQVFELNRLCVDGEIKIKLSQFVGWCLRKISEKNLILISYADTQMNHHGYIYQATNWLYTGMTKKRTDNYTENGQHHRHTSDNEPSGLRKVRSAKYRYIFFACKNKILKKEYRNALNYKVEAYPKGDNSRYTLGDIMQPIIIKL